MCYAATFPVTSEKSIGYERLARDDSSSSDEDDDGDEYDEDINEDVLFVLTNANSGKVKGKSCISALCWVACIAIASVAVFSLAVYFIRTKSVTNYLKQPHTNRTQEVSKRYRKTPEWTMKLAGFGMFLSQDAHI